MEYQTGLAPRDDTVLYSVICYRFIGLYKDAQYLFWPTSCIYTLRVAFRNIPCLSDSMVDLETGSYTNICSCRAPVILGQSMQGLQLVSIDNIGSKPEEGS